MIEEIDALREELSRMRPLTQREIERLRKSFIEEYTYNSTAIEGNVDAENLGDINTADTFSFLLTDQETQEYTRRISGELKPRLTP